VLITRGCPVRELTPLAGQAHLSAQAALMALLTPIPRVLLTGGEEIGTWFRDLDAASHVGFAFAVALGDPESESPAPAGALGELRWSDGEPRSAGSAAPAAALPACDLRELFYAVRDRRYMRCPSPAGGEIELAWF
jgi:hypothetical protein